MTSFERNHTAKSIKNIRKILNQGKSEPIPCSCSNCELQLIDNSPADTNKLFSAGMLGMCLLLAGLMLVAGCWATPAHAYTDEQYVNAIYKAEGGIHAKHPFGISNAKCSTFQACKEICTRTVRNNKKRYKQYGFKRYSRFIQFLGSRYCPTSGGNLSKSEVRLNRFWIANVSYFLKNERIS